MQVTTKYRFLVSTIGLIVGGVALIAIANTFHHEAAKLELDHLLAEVGALLLVVGSLHWLFEFGLRAEMLREVSKAVIGATQLHDSGLDDCVLNSKLVNERAHWTRAPTLEIGIQYSPQFFKEYHDILKARCIARLPTIVTALTPDGAAAKYLQDSKTGLAQVDEGLRDIRNILAELDAGKDKQIQLFTHDRVLRYSFIATNELIWIKFFTNSNGRASVPALKIRAGTPLFHFFQTDIERLRNQSHANL